MPGQFPPALEYHWGDIAGRRMDTAAILAQRLQALGWTQYRLTKEVIRLKGEDAPVTRYNSSIKTTLNNPENSKFENVRDLVKAMGGEIVIRFPEDYTVD
jgi:hypothetical protein